MMYPVMLPGTGRDDLWASGFRNPDGLFPEQIGTPPDPMGVMFIRFLAFLSDTWERFHRRGDPPAPEDIRSSDVVSRAGVFDAR